MNNCKDNMMKCNNTPKLEGLRDRLIAVAYIRYNTANIKIRILSNCFTIQFVNLLLEVMKSVHNRIIGIT